MLTFCFFERRYYITPEYAQELLMIVKRTVESHLNLLPIPGPKGHKFRATQMIIRSVRGNAGGAGEEGKVSFIFGTRPGVSPGLLFARRFTSSD